MADHLDGTKRTIYGVLSGGEDAVGLTQAKLKEMFSYDQETGLFTRLVARGNRAPVGAVAGSVNKSDGYVRIWIDGKVYYAHRLAWLYVHGEWPVGLLDHRDLNRSHNWLNNLRPATDGQNKCNSTRRLVNKSGFKGVSWNKQISRWVAQICFANKRKHIGYFDTAEEAHDAYMRAAREHHGDFARSE